MIRRSNEKNVEHKPAPFNGDGDITVRHLLNGQEEMYGKGRVFAHSTLEPGCAIGYHVHENESETYYFYSGKGELNDNGTIVTAVSYTHLDVYKRQSPGGAYSGYAGDEMHHLCAGQGARAEHR